MTQRPTYLGKMHIVYGACGHVVAACWVRGNEQDAANFKRRKLRPGQRLETVVAANLGDVVSVPAELVQQQGEGGEKV